MRYRSFYAETIRRLTKANPAQVEAWMRLKFSTLDGLSRSEFLQEVRVAERCIAVDPDGSAALAASYGLGGAE